MAGIAPISGVGVDALAFYKSLPQYQSAGAADAAAPAAGGPSFASMVGEKVQAAMDLQNQGNAAAQALATGTATDVSAATIAVEKASIALQLVSAFRNKAIESYQEVMRMQV